MQDCPSIVIVLNYLSNRREITTDIWLYIAIISFVKKCVSWQLKNDTLKLWFPVDEIRLGNKLNTSSVIYGPTNIAHIVKIKKSLVPKSFVFSTGS